MATVIHKFLNNKSSLRTIASITISPADLSKISPPLINHPNNLISGSEMGYEDDPVPLVNPIKTVAGKSDDPLRVFPSFPFGYCFNPILRADSGLMEAAENDDSGMVYADSVKKKRKTKMNKHKYKKLRKRLGQKT